MARLLLVDDDRFLLRGIEKLLTAEGYYCETAVNAHDVRRTLQQSGPFDLIVLDVGLPDEDGFTLCRQIRAGHHMPILFLTARDDSADKVVGLELGADDYLTKPFQPRELVARIRANLRRMAEYSAPPEKDRRIQIDTLAIDPDRRDVFRAETPLGLTDREFELLYFMGRHLNKALATDLIFQNVWGFDAVSGTKTLAVTVRRIRLKIEADPEHPLYLQTVRGFGYKLTRPGR